MVKILTALMMFAGWYGWGSTCVFFVYLVLYCLLGVNGEDAKATIRVAPFRVPDPVLMEHHCKAEMDLIAFEARIGRRRDMGQVLIYAAMALAFVVGYRAGRPNDDEGQMIRSFGTAPRQPLPSPSRPRHSSYQCREAAVLLIEGRVLPPVSLREPWPHLVIDRVAMASYTFSFCR